jgi:hypothetical protein
MTAMQAAVESVVLQAADTVVIMIVILLAVPAVAIVAIVHAASAVKTVLVNYMFIGIHSNELC